MNVIKRKNTPPTQFGRSSNGEGKFRFMLQIKLALVLLCAGLGYFVYSNWQSWLESLDADRKITAYALVGQNEFTTYPDVQDVLLKMGSLKGFWGQDVKQIQEQLKTIPWVKGAVVRKIWPNRLQQPPFVLNTRKRTLEKNGQRIKLTQVEYAIMKMFMENPGKALSREEILKFVWGENYLGELKIVDVNIRRLRVKIEDEPTSPAFITTIWGYGYKWEF